MIQFVLEFFFILKNNFFSSYEKAKEHFVNVYKILSSKFIISSLPEKWEPLLNNLGHVCRKLGQFDESIKYHTEAINLKPHNASTFGALGLVYCLRGDLETACNYFDNVNLYKSFNTFDFNYSFFNYFF